MPDAPSSEAPTERLATFGGGCFWCVEAVYRLLNGVRRVDPGYAGGTVPHPTYEAVCTGRTGHAEVVQIAYDPRIVSYRDLVRIFFTVHDPTTVNRQGNDVGPQYRSVIFVRDSDEERTVREVISEVTNERLYSRPIVTEVVPFTAFYPAEEYHREYFERHPEQAYCQFVIAPKVAKFRRQYADRLRRP